MEGFLAAAEVTGGISFYLRSDVEALAQRRQAAQQRDRS